MRKHCVASLLHSKSHTRRSLEDERSFVVAPGSRRQARRNRSYRYNTIVDCGTTSTIDSAERIGTV